MTHTTLIIGSCSRGLFLNPEWFGETLGALHMVGLRSTPLQGCFLVYFGGSLVDQKRTG